MFEWRKLRLCAAAGMGAILRVPWKVGIVGIALVSGVSNASADRWVVTGRIQVRHQLRELIDEYDARDGSEDGVAESPLAEVEVKVQGRARVGFFWGTWSNWGTDFTDDDGEFRVTEDAGSTRQIRVRVRFRNDNLTIRDAEGLIDSAAWYTIYQAERSSGTISLGNRTFQAGGGSDLDDSEAREQAEFWVLGNLIRDEMAAQGYPFTDELIIEQGYHTGPISYCNPFDNVVHIHRDAFDTSTVIHEVMHSWLFRHMSGEDALLGQLLEGSTHCLQDSGESWVSFVEGFSEYCENELQARLFGASLLAPFNRPYLNDGVRNYESCGDRLTSLSRMERHCAGWVDLFRVLSRGRSIVTYDLNTATSSGRAAYSGHPWFLFNAPSLNFQDILDTITNNSRSGQMDRDDMNFADFLALVVARNPDENVYPGLVDAWLQLLDPTESVQPWELFP